MKVLKRLSGERKVALFSLIIIFLPFINAQVETNLNITKIPPILLMPIPNQSWPVNSGVSNAFDLDDYFASSDGSPLTYTYSNPQNVSIIIDSSNIVSFYSDPDFIGNRNMTFTADDGDFNNTSNLVFLFVGTDIQPPQWSSPAKSKSTIYQNDYVNFSLSWRDNVQLAQYIFSINQGSGWFSYPEVNFSGIQNNSVYRAQISSPGGSIIYWKFCAYDNSNNLNCSDEWSFNVTTKTSPPSGGGGESSGGEGAGDQGELTAASAASSSQAQKKIINFSVDPYFFKVTLKQGESDTRLLKVSNIGNSNILINLSIIGLENFILLSKEYLNLSFGETEKITLDIISKNNTPPEQYFGKILLKSNAGNIGVPIILDITPFDVAVDLKVNVLDKNKPVISGKEVFANVTIYNLKEVSPNEFTLYTAIKDLNGNIYDSHQEKINLVSVYSAKKNLTMPKDSPGGEYIFYARVFNGNIVNINSDLFEVGQKFKLEAFLKSSLIFIFLIVLTLVSLILAFKYRKEKEKEKLLNLYLMLNELKEFIKQEKIEEAIELYIRLKRNYGEHVSKTTLDKERIKSEMKELSKKLNSQIEESGGNIQDIKKEANELKGEQKVEEKIDNSKDAK